jgi:hypothetical protein
VQIMYLSCLMYEYIKIFIKIILKVMRYIVLFFELLRV